MQLASADPVRRAARKTQRQSARDLALHATNESHQSAHDLVRTAAAESQRSAHHDLRVIAATIALTKTVTPAAPDPRGHTTKAASPPSTSSAPR